MAETQGKVYVYEDDRSLTFKVEGRATMRPCQAVRQRADRFLAQGAGTVHVDLIQATYLDSTFIGALLYLQRSARSKSGEFALICPSQACVHVLEQMGLKNVFPIRSDPVPIEDWEDLDGTSDALETLQRSLIESHLELAKLPGPAGEPFRPVAERLAHEWEEQHKPRNGSPPQHTSKN
jgi:anti-anti-sigma factor